jgi:tetrapyrrole methylase family protein / MazG family protein
MVARKKLSKKPAKRRRSARKAARGDGLSAGARFDKLVALQKRLRAPNGCPWDREQTHATLRTYLVEEAYEVLDALESGDDAKFAEEMGDLLLQIVFHSEIAAEEGRFTVADVIREIHEKMVRRHPHVFGTKRAKDSAEVLKNWEQIKLEERKAEKASGKSSGEKEKQVSILDGVPRALPALLEGLQLTKKAARVGFDWEAVAGIFDKLREESAEIERALEKKDRSKIEEELGDLLFAGVNLARFLHVDPEIALKSANAKFLRRFQEMERLASESGRRFVDVPRAEMEALWDSAKRGEEILSATGAAQNR